MRASVDKDDPGYAPHSIGAKVFLDGVQRSHVVTADEEKRLIVRYVTDEKGRFKIDGDNVRRETLYGDVRIELP